MGEKIANTTIKSQEAKKFIGYRSLLIINALEVVCQ